MEIVEAILTIDVPPHAAYNANKFHRGSEFPPAINIFANSMDFTFYIWQNTMNLFEINKQPPEANLRAASLPQPELSRTFEFFVFSLP